MGITTAQRMRHLTDREFETSLSEMTKEELENEKETLVQRLEQAEFENTERNKLIETQIDNPAMEHLIDMSIALTSNDYEIPQLKIRIGMIDKALENRS